MLKAISDDGIGQRAGVPIKIAGVTKRYAIARGGEVHALSEINLNIAAGEFVSIVGPSGCGKSTLLMLISGLIPPTSGAIEVAGAPVKGAVGNVVVEPHVNQSIYLTGLGEQVGERLTEMARLRLEAGLFIKLEMGRNHSGLDPIVSMVDQHAFLHELGATAAPSRSCEPGEFGVNSPSIAWKRGRLAAPTHPAPQAGEPASIRWVRITGTTILATSTTFTTLTLPRGKQLFAFLASASAT